MVCVYHFPKSTDTVLLYPWKGRSSMSVPQCSRRLQLLQRHSNPGLALPQKENRKPKQQESKTQHIQHCSHPDLLRSFISKTKTNNFSSLRGTGLCLPLIPCWLGLQAQCCAPGMECWAGICLALHHGLVIHTNASPSLLEHKEGQHTDESAIHVYSTAPLQC